MRVISVLVGTAARTGGTAAFVGESAAELRRLGDEVTVVATDLAFASAGWMQRQARIAADERHASLRDGVRMFPARFPRRLAFSPSLARALPTLVAQADVVHLHNLWQYPQYAGWRAAMDAGTPYVVSPHGALDPYLRGRGAGRKRASMLLYQQRLLEGAALIHVTTAAEQEAIADIAPEVPRAVVPCGIHVGQFAGVADGRVSGSEFRARTLDGFDGPVVLFLGRLSFKKGLDVLIRAFARVRRELDCRLVIAGGDDEGLTPGLTRVARDCGIGRDVVFAGPVYGEDRLGALAAADVWALPSFAENFGIAVVEAMAAGRPVLISPGVSLAAEVAAAGAGIVAEASAQPFAEALAALLSDRTAREALGAEARRFAAGYDWSVVAHPLREMYRRAAGAQAVSLVPARSPV